MDISARVSQQLKTDHPFAEAAPPPRTNRQLISDVLGVWSLGTIVFGSIGPFETGDFLPLPLSLLFWAYVIALACILHLGVQTVLVRLTHIDHAVRIFLGALSFAAIFTPIANASIAIIPNSAAPGHIRVFLSTMALSAFVFFIQRLVAQLRRGRANVNTPVNMDLIYDTGDLLHVEWFHGRVLVHSILGSELIDGDFATMLESLGYVDGMRIHRNHWVARQGVIGLFRQNDEPYALLHDGSHAPVGLAYEKLVFSEFKELEEKRMVV